MIQKNLSLTHAYTHIDTSTTHTFSYTQTNQMMRKFQKVKGNKKPGRSRRGIFS